MGQNLKHCSLDIIYTNDPTERLADHNLGVRVAVDIDTAVRSLPNRSAWLRRVITEAARRELINVGNAQEN